MSCSPVCDLDVRKLIGPPYAKRISQMVGEAPNRSAKSRRIKYTSVLKRLGFERASLPRAHEMKNSFRKKCSIAPVSQMGKFRDWTSKA
jgi:hypothetical protein